MQNKCLIQDLGLIDYEKAYALQKECVASVLNGGQESLFLCEHPAVITLGRLTKQENILASGKELEKKGIKLVAIDRGGDVTLHSPGQLVVYPILNLKNHGKDLKRYLYQLEEVAIDFLKGFDILSGRFSGRTGVWIGTKKIVSLGIGVRQWISFHGMAINLNTDLTQFSFIRPCGLEVMMTSVEEITGREVDLAQAKKGLAQRFLKHFYI